MLSIVTPLAGVWIEMPLPWTYSFACLVTPLAGVWIEMIRGGRAYLEDMGHSPCGSVD